MARRRGATFRRKPGIPESRMFRESAKLGISGNLRKCKKWRNGEMAETQRCGKLRNGGKRKKRRNAKTAKSAKSGKTHFCAFREFPKFPVLEKTGNARSSEVGKFPSAIGASPPPPRNPPALVGGGCWVVGGGWWVGDCPDFSFLEFFKKYPLCPGCENAKSKISESPYVPLFTNSGKF